MARPYSLALRERVVAAIQSGQSCRAVAARFGIGVASVVKWSQRFRATGSPATKPMGGHRPFALAGEQDCLLARVSEQPDITTRALAAKHVGCGVKVSHVAVWNFLKRERLTFKKSLCASEQDRADVARRGAR